MSQENIERKANAPYNFVPLNEYVVPGETAPDGDRYYDNENRVTGYINYELETLTPFFIGNKLKINQTDDNGTQQFNSMGGKVRIPGSSLRGMIRTLVEIMSWGKFECFDNKPLFYRTFDKSSLSKEYRKAINPKTNLKAGYLYKKGINYYIIPAKINSDGLQFKRLDNNTIQNQFTVTKNTDGKWHIRSGEFKEKTHVWSIETPDYKKEKILLSAEDIRVYEGDLCRYKDKRNDNEKKERDGDLLRLLRISEEGIVPCFFVKWTDSKGQERIAFGHTAFFRFPYRYSIGDHILQNLKDNIYDIPDSIFGDTVHAASRAFFEDAILQAKNQDDLYDKEVVLTLSSPKPTTFQHYLTQNEDAFIKTLKHWNDQDIKIRGYKLYWHKKNELPPVKKETLKEFEQKIRPIKPKNIFTGRIRFENLTKIELGALLFALDLPDNLHHKLGMGKPYGLGSVKISPRLFLSDRIARYRKIFESNGWYLAEREENMEDFKQEFQKYLLKQINSSAASLWEIDRMKQLSAMLDFSNTGLNNWPMGTAYMTLKGKDFNNRPILPPATEVAHSAKRGE